MDLTKLGVSTREQATAELLDKFGLNWKVEKQPLILPSGKISGFEAIIREDTETVFSVCTPQYQPFQNQELLELVNEAAENVSLKVTKGGKFKDGALVYLQLDSGSINGIGQNNDTLQKYITAMNSHNGSLSLKWGITNITISCQNTFWAATHEMRNSVKHTITMHSRVDALMNQIKNVQKAEKTLYEKFFKLAEIPTQKQHIEKVVKLVLDIDLNGGSQDISTYKKNRLHDLSGAINKEMKQKGETLWGLFSGVTYYTTHLMSGDTNSRMQSKAIGQGSSIDNDVFSELELVLK